VIELDEILLSLCPAARWSVINNEIVWHDTEVSQPSAEAIESERVRLQTLRDNTQYRRSRAAEYPPIGDQLDALFHAGVFPAEMAARIQAVKDRYPKGKLNDN
jgi:hypothetical protein